MAVKIDTDVCVGCGCCSDVCTPGALELRETAEVNQAFCIECKQCIDMCPALAIRLPAAQE